ncbi:MAG: hypothetical protein WC773_00840 [Patescibacteria group bacterium]
MQDEVKTTVNLICVVVGIIVVLGIITTVVRRNEGSYSGASSMATAPTPSQAEPTTQVAQPQQAEPVQNQPDRTLPILLGESLPDQEIKLGVPGDGLVVKGPTMGGWSPAELSYSTDDKLGYHIDTRSDHVGPDVGGKFVGTAAFYKSFRESLTAGELLPQDVMDGSCTPLMPINGAMSPGQVAGEIYFVIHPKRNPSDTWVVACIVDGQITSKISLIRDDGTRDTSYTSSVGLSSFHVKSVAAYRSTRLMDDIPNASRGDFVVVTMNPGA